MDVTTLQLLGLFAIAVIPFAPTELALVGVGVVAAAQDAPLVAPVAVAIAGCLICDYALYVAGRRGSGTLDRLRARPSATRTVDWLAARLGRRPVAALVIARWLPAGGMGGSLLAGALGWRRPVFVTASLIGVTVWCSYAALLGYVGGSLVREPLVSLLVSLVVAAVLSLATTTVFRRRTGHDLRYARGTSGGPVVHPAKPA